MTTSSDSRASFSNYGTCLDLFAPGSSITAAWHTSDLATNTISGTLMASPHVAGVAALYLDDHPGASPSAVRDAIVGGATSGRLSSVRSGSLSGSGDFDYHPDGTYYYSRSSGQHRGCLIGPSGTDFDLYLWKWNGRSWQIAARGNGSTSVENISYSGTRGYYLWSVESYSGRGSYDLHMSRP